jgi:hypothetical protein
LIRRFRLPFATIAIALFIFFFIPLLPFAVIRGALPLSSSAARRGRFRLWLCPRLGLCLFGFGGLRGRGSQLFLLPLRVAGGGGSLCSSASIAANYVIDFLNVVVSRGVVLLPPPLLALAIVLVV